MSTLDMCNPPRHIRVSHGSTAHQQHSHHGNAENILIDDAQVLRDVAERDGVGDRPHLRSGRLSAPSSPSTSVCPV
jgi:hypothetical protein